MADKRIQQYPLKATIGATDLILIADVSDVDVNGFFKYKKVEAETLATSLSRATVLTRAELIAFVNASALIQGSAYVISDAVGGTLSLLVQAASSNLLGEYAVSTTTGETYKYDITTDTAILEPNPIALGTANQLLGVNAGGTEQEYKTLSGTNNQVTVTHGVGGITLSLPQNIHTGATPTFAGLTLTAAAGTNRDLSYQTAGVDRWKWRTNNVAESGGNAGSNLELLRYNDAGAQIGGVVMGVNRSTGATSLISLTLTTALAASSGGTGNSATPTVGQLLIGNGSGYTLATLTGTANQVTVTNGAGSITLSLPQSISTTSSPTFAGLTLTSALTASNGGTGQSVYVVGDILYASTTTALSRLAGVATGNALISGGVNTAPSWGKIGLTTHVSGTLGVGNGGTGLSTAPTNGQLLIGNGTAYTLATLTGTANQVTVTNGAGTITLSLPQSIATTSDVRFNTLTLGGVIGSNAFRILTNITGGANRNGMSIGSQIQSDVTSNVIIYESFPMTQAAAFTLGDLYHFGAFQGTIGAGSSVTRQRGFFVSSNMIGATNNYAFQGQIPSGTGRWNAYMDGTANNYFAGNVQIGSATPTAGAEKLQVTGTASVSGALSIGNTVTASVGTPSTHKVTMVIGGVTYYLLATNV